MDDNPSVFNELDQIDQIIEKIDDKDALDAFERQILVTIARSGFTAECFKAFFQVVFNKVITEQGAKWIETIFEARKERTGAVIEAFRGSSAWVPSAGDRRCLQVGGFPCWPGFPPGAGRPFRRRVGGRIWPTRAEFRRLCPG